jgi:uncharacterized membrane protein
MKVLDWLYGGAYDSHQKQGLEIDKGRTQTNWIISTFVLIYLLLIIVGLTFVSASFSDGLIDLIEDTFGRRSGRGIAILVIIPLFMLIYGIIGLLIGTKKQYEKSYQIFNTAPTIDREQALGRCIAIGGGGILLLTILLIASLF